MQIFTNVEKTRFFKTDLCVKDLAPLEISSVREFFDLGLDPLILLDLKSWAVGDFEELLVSDARGIIDVNLDFIGEKSGFEILREIFGFMEGGRITEDFINSIMPAFPTASKTFVSGGKYWEIRNPEGAGCRINIRNGELPTFNFRPSQGAWQLKNRPEEPPMAYAPQRVCPFALARKACKSAGGHRTRKDSLNYHIAKAVDFSAGDSEMRFIEAVNAWASKNKTTEK